MADSIPRGKRLDVASDLAEAQLGRAQQIAKSAGFADDDEALIGAVLQAIVTNYWDALKQGAG